MTEPFAGLHACHAVVDSSDALLQLVAVLADLEAVEARLLFENHDFQEAAKRLEGIAAELVRILAAQLRSGSSAEFILPPAPRDPPADAITSLQRQEAVEIVEAILAEPEQPLPAPDPDERLSVEAAALALGIAPYKVYYAIQHGHLPASGPPRALGVARRDLEVYRETKLGKRAPKPTLAGRLGEEIPRSR